MNTYKDLGTVPAPVNSGLALLCEDFARISVENQAVFEDLIKGVQTTQDRLQSGYIGTSKQRQLFMQL